MRPSELAALPLPRALEPTAVPQLSSAERAAPDGCRAEAGGTGLRRTCPRGEWGAMWVTGWAALAAPSLALREMHLLS